MIAPGKPFQRSLMFVSKTGAYPSGTSFYVLSLRVGYMALPINIRLSWKSFLGTLMLITKFRNLWMEKVLYYWPRDLYYKTLRIRNLREINKFRSKLVLSGMEKLH